MGSELVSSYLLRKFSSTLEEAEADPSSPLQFVSRFRSTEELFNSTDPSKIPVELLYDLMDAVSECRIFAHRRRKESTSKKGFYLFRLFFFEYNMKKRLDEIERQLIKDIHTNNGRSSSGEGLPVIERTKPNSPDPSRIIGFESQAKEIEDLLLTTECTAIGIVGSTRCGKTALAQKVFGSPRIEEEFSPRIWLCLSDMQFEEERVDLRLRVLYAIWDEIGNRGALDVMCSVVDLLEDLQRQLGWKRYLIVLDDVVWRERHEWYAGLGCGSGGAVMVTSREEDVMRRAVGDDKHVIRPNLSDQICWKIFSDQVRNRWKTEPDRHPNFIKLKDDVIADCDGIPLAANETFPHDIVRLRRAERVPRLPS